MTHALMTLTERNAFFDALDQVYHDPRCELTYTSDFTLLISIILSAQSTDKNVNRVTAVLFPVADTPAKIKALGLDALKGYLKSINYFNNKATHIYRLADILLTRFNGQVPTDFDTLITLPGVGRKTANVFLNVAYDAPRLGVDTHVFRLCHRLKICTGKTPVEIEKKLEKLIPERYKKQASLALVLHGRYICKATRPACSLCPLAHVCIADDKNMPVKPAQKTEKTRSQSTRKRKTI